MIFVAVGTQRIQFNRLLENIDKLIEKKKITEPVFAQTGYCTYEPRLYKSEQFLSKCDFTKAINECNVLITHSGVGTIIEGMKSNKPVIVFPRRSEFKEHVDDHQLQIAEAFSSKNCVLQANSIQELEKCLVECRVHKFDKYKSGNGKLVKDIDDFLKKL